MTDKIKDPAKLQRTYLANEEMGNNQLHGNDQENIRNERHAYPDEKRDSDGIIESFEKLDKDVRAERDLGKGNTNTPPENE